MTYVVGRRDGRFEIRESHQTPHGPRARTLASFRVLSVGVLSHAASRAGRPLDVQSVLASARRAGAPVEESGGQRTVEQARAAFVAASRGMAALTAKPARDRVSIDAGAALMELLGFADAVARSQPARPAAPLEFPALGERAKRSAGSDLACAVAKDV